MKAMFVYGLLKPGFSLFPVAEPFVVESFEGTAKGRLYDDGVPAARFDEEGEIDGFVFVLDGDRADAALEVLDELEDEGIVYERREIEVSTGRGPVSAYAYHYLKPIDPDTDVGREWVAGERKA